MTDGRKISAVVLDLTGNAMEWLDEYADENRLEICEVLTLDENSPISISDLNKYDNWDILLVFEKGVREKAEHLLMRVGIERSKILYPLDFEGAMYDRRDISSAFLNDRARRLMEYVSCRRTEEKYALVSAEKLSYINVATDNTILPKMIMTQKNWAYDDMRLFFDLSKNYFSFNEDQVYFCDIGSNIGTTSIYFKKYLDEDIKIMAFEPSSENYKLLRINLLLNDIEPSEHMICNIGLSDTCGNAVISYNPNNPGGTSLVNDSFDVKERVDLVSFDYFLEENGISSGHIKYLWIDVEGYEARFLAGARDTLSNINVPVFMEFVPRFYMHKNGEFELLIEELERHFSYFIRTDRQEQGKLPIERLREEKHNTTLGCDLFLLKE